MSRVIVLDLENKSVGEFDAKCALGWTLYGHPGVTGGGMASVPVPFETATQPWLNFGRMVVIVPDADLPAYVGVIDTPWQAHLPAHMTVYDAELLFAMRVVERAPVKFSGAVDALAEVIIDEANRGEDLFLRLGDVGELDRRGREETLDGRHLWEQLQALLLRAKTEMILRAERDADQRWMVYADLGERLGTDTDWELRDGDNGNMTVMEAWVRGEITNRMVGVSTQSTRESRLATPPLFNEESIALYRMRTGMPQFRDVKEMSTLVRNTQAALDAQAMPYLELTVEARNVDHAFRYLRPGNRLLAHASKIILPGGQRGWRGVTRILRMAYSESTGTISMTLQGELT